MSALFGERFYLTILSLICVHNVMPTLACRHWIAVFGMFLPRDCKMHVESLRKHYQLGEGKETLLIHSEHVVIRMIFDVLK